MDVSLIRDQIRFLYIWITDLENSLLKVPTHDDDTTHIDNIRRRLKYLHAQVSLLETLREDLQCSVYHS